MKKFLLLIIALFIPILTSCKIVEPKTAVPQAKTVIEEFVAKAVAAKKEVRLALKADRQGNEIKVIVTLENPNLRPITSVQTWLSFEPSRLQGKEINVKNSAFSLMAPYDNTFDNKEGLVMIGRSNPTPVNDKSIKVAEVTFTLMKNETTMVDAYDYQDDLSGHTSANTLVKNTPFNIMLPPESPALIVIGNRP